MENNSGFSRRLVRRLPYSFSVRVTASELHGGFSFHAPDPLAPVSPLPAPAFPPCPHSSVPIRYRNLHLLSIGYASLPRLRPRLPQGRSALPWKPWIFGLGDSHPHLATHSGILSSKRSTAPCRYCFAAFSMLLYRCIRCIPRLRCRVSAPDIFGAGTLD